MTCGERSSSSRISIQRSPGRCRDLAKASRLESAGVPATTAGGAQRLVDVSGRHAGTGHQARPPGQGHRDRAKPGQGRRGRAAAGTGPPGQGRDATSRPGRDGCAGVVRVTGRTPGVHPREGRTPPIRCGGSQPSRTSETAREPSRPCLIPTSLRFARIGYIPRLPWWWCEHVSGVLAPAAGERGSDRGAGGAGAGVAVRADRRAA
jgi:hypothetical protein